jgi:putative hydroxymethylpyrimidine transporter CytX
MTDTRTTSLSDLSTGDDWGIEPVPPRLKTFGFFDVGALWGNLGISLLLPIVAAFLVPGLSFTRALLAIGVGVVIGNVMLGYAGQIGAATGAPAMVLLRPALGRSGSYAPTALNILQNIGWGAFEILIIASASAALAERALPNATWLQPLWTVVFGTIVTLMAVGGPLRIVRQWIKRYAVWFVLASSLFLTVYVLTSVPLSTFTSVRGEGMPFWAGVDLVVAMPISWIPLAADYTRFARSPRAAFAGTAIGYGVAHAWFYVLGVLLILSNIATDPTDPTGFVSAVMAVPVGVLALAILAVDETDEGFANVYSASVSVQNAFPRWSQRKISIVIGSVCTLIALVVPLVQYENFLLLIGAVFVPLFGVLAAHHAVVRRGYLREEIYAPRPGVRVWPVVAWIIGFLVYNWINPGTVSWWVSAMDASLGWLARPPSWISASIAAFVVAFALESLERIVRGRVGAAQG